MNFRILSFLLVFICTMAKAQPGDPGGDPDKVPISGIEFLIGTGAILGLKRIWDKRKNPSQ